MLDIELLNCEIRQYHKNCQWVHAKIRYPNTQYLLVKQRLSQEVLKTGTAYRITHWKFGILATFKRGHDGSLYVGENKEALRNFALYGGE